MDYAQLEHAIRAAREVSGDTELLIFGSQAILGSYPNAPKGLRASIEIDMQAKNLPDRTELIAGGLGRRLALSHDAWLLGRWRADRCRQAARGMGEQNHCSIAPRRDQG